MDRALWVPNTNGSSSKFPKNSQNFPRFWSRIPQIFQRIPRISWVFPKISNVNLQSFPTVQHSLTKVMSRTQARMHRPTRVNLCSVTKIPLCRATSNELNKSSFLFHTPFAKLNVNFNSVLCEPAKRNTNGSGHLLPAKLFAHQKNRPWARTNGSGFPRFQKLGTAWV